jgi:hypothetical protein
MQSKLIFGPLQKAKKRLLRLIRGIRGVEMHHQRKHRQFSNYDAVEYARFEGDSLRQIELLG